RVITVDSADVIAIRTIKPMAMPRIRFRMVGRSIDLCSDGTAMIGKRVESNKSESPARTGRACCLARAGELSTVRRVKIDDSWERYGRSYPFQTPAGWRTATLSLFQTLIL